MLAKVADAIIFPPGTFARSPLGPLPAAQAAFAEALGSRAVHTSWIGSDGGFNLATGVGGHGGLSLFYPGGHPQQGEERLVWFPAIVGPDGRVADLGEPLLSYRDGLPGVLIGYLKNDPAAGDLTVRLRVDAALNAQTTERRARVESALRTPAGRATFMDRMGVDEAWLDEHFPGSTTAGGYNPPVPAPAAAHAEH